LRCYESALELDPGYAPAHLGFGDSQDNRGDLPRALQHWEMALGDGTAWAMQALERIARVSSGIDDGARVEGACAKVLDRHPHSWRVQLVLARLHRKRGDLEAAREALTRALTEKPGSITVQRELWQVLDEQGDDGNAVGELFAGVIREARLVDPYVCLKCGFKASQPFARCPHCHDWNTVADEQS